MKTTLWFKILTIVLMMPLAMFPAYLGSIPADGTARLLVWLYPAYVIATGICAWLSYPRRPEVAWILLVLLALSHAAMFILIQNS